MNKFTKALPYFFLSLLLTQNIFATQISYNIDNGSFKKKHSVYLTPSQKLTLKFDVKNAKTIKWYQIIPDTSKFYKNANHPWEENAYKWTGYGKISYEKVEIKAFENKTELELSSKILEANRPKNNTFYNSQLILTFV